jgi:hypothetical protein|tara:strand:- start:13 stop:300 length:288 start_codon:yes stop_codon:yes gene_type:complete
MFQKNNRRGRGMKNKIIANQLVSESQLNEFIERDCKLLTSKDLAKVLNVTEAALRKQRSNNRSLFPFSRLGRRIYYPADLIVKTVHNNIQEAQLR